MDLEKIIEALLFISGEPVSEKELMRLSGAKKAELEAALQVLGESLKTRGIRLVYHADRYTLATAPDVAPIAETLVKERLEGELSKPQLETLAIILWKRSVSRASIDYIRGVNSAFSLRALLVRGLIMREQDSKDARIFNYSPTIDLLKFLGVTSITELPEFESITKEIKEYA